MALDLWALNASPTEWAPPVAFSIGFPTAGDEVTQTPPTHVGGHWIASMAKEIRSVIEAAGITLDPTDPTQFLAAIRILFAVSAPPPPPPAPNPHTGNVVALLHFNGADGSQTFTDSAPIPNTWTLAPPGSGVHLSAAAAVLGDAALVSTGNLQGIGANFPSSLSMAGTFTIAFRWTVPADFSTGGTYRFITCCDGFNGEHILGFFVAGGVLQWYQGVFGATDTRLAFNDVPPFVAGNTYAIAISRDANHVVRAAINGVVSGVTGVDTSDYTHAPTSTLFIGTINSAFGPASPIGAVDEYLISTDCLFTSNYTVQTTEFDPSTIQPF